MGWMNYIRQTSFWDQDQFNGPPPPEVNPPGRKPPPKEITNNQLEDWAHRIASMAVQPVDTDLEGDLLDLRDDIVYALHERLRGQ